MTREPHWVVIGSANGSGNLGDEAMWHAAVQSLRETVGPVEVVTDTSRPWGADGVPSVRELPYLYTSLVRAGHLQRARFAPVRQVARAIGRLGRWRVARARYRKALDEPRGWLQREWFKTVTTAQGVLFSGAGAITDRYAVNGVYAWSLLAQWADRAGVPVAFLGQGLGPLSTEHREAARAGLAVAGLVGARDARSLTTATDWGISTARLQPDWATLAVPGEGDRARALEVAPGGPFLAVCLHSIVAEQTEGALSRALATIATFAREKHLKVLLVPNMRGDGANDDERTMRRLISRLPATEQTDLQMVSDVLNARETRALLGLAEIVIATRYHSLVFALAEGRWTAGVAIDEYWAQKLRGAQSSAAQPQLVVAAGADPEELRELLDEALTRASDSPLAPLSGAAAAQDLSGFVKATVAKPRLNGHAT